jgi:hypothetical protein
VATTRKRIQITIQTEQVMIIRRSGCPRLWCPVCSREVDVVDLVQAEALTGIAQPRIHECAATNRFHYLNGPGGTVLLCLDSLLKGL